MLPLPLHETVGSRRDLADPGSECAAFRQIFAGRYRLGNSEWTAEAADVRPYGILMARAEHLEQLWGVRCGSGWIKEETLRSWESREAEQRLEAAAQLVATNAVMSGMAQVGEVAQAAAGQVAEEVAKRQAVEEESDAASRLPAPSDIVSGSSRMVQHSGTMRVLLSHARGLKSMDSNGYSDPYAKLILGEQKHKSQTKKKTLNPVWKEEFNFCGSFDDLVQTYLHVQMWDWDRFSKNDRVGDGMLDLRTLGLHHGSAVDCTVRLNDGQPSPGEVFLVVTWLPDSSQQHEEAAMGKAAEKAAAAKAAHEAAAAKAVEGAAVSKAAEETAVAKAAEQAAARKAVEKATAAKATAGATATAAEEAAAAKAAEETAAAKATEEVAARKAAEKNAAKASGEAVEAKTVEMDAAAKATENPVGAEADEAERRAAAERAAKEAAARAEAALAAKKAAIAKAAAARKAAEDARVKSWRVLTQEPEEARAAAKLRGGASGDGLKPPQWVNANARVSLRRNSMDQAAAHRDPVTKSDSSVALRPVPVVGPSAAAATTFAAAPATPKVAATAHRAGLPAASAPEASAWIRCLPWAMCVCDPETQLGFLLEKQRAMLGSSHPDTIASITSLQKLKHAQGDREAELPLLQEVVASRRRAYGNLDASTLRAIGNLGALRYQMGDLDGAAPLLTEALAGQRRTVGDTHVDTLKAVNNLAMLKWDQQDLDGAHSLLSEVLKGKRNTLGTTHASTLSSMYNLASLELARGEGLAAVSLLREALAAQTVQHGSDAEETRALADDLMHVLTAQGELNVVAALAVKYGLGVPAAATPARDEHRAPRPRQPHPRAPTAPTSRNFMPW